MANIGSGFAVAADGKSGQCWNLWGWGSKGGLKFYISRLIFNTSKFIASCSCRERIYSSGLP